MANLSDINEYPATSQKKDWKFHIIVEEVDLETISKLIKLIQTGADLAGVQVGISACEDDTPLLTEWEEPSAGTGEREVSAFNWMDDGQEPAPEVWMCANGHESNKPGMCRHDVVPGIMCCLFPTKVERR